MHHISVYHSSNIINSAFLALKQEKSRFLFEDKLYHLIGYL